MPEENARIKIITIKDSHIENLKIKGFRQNPLIIKDLTLKNVRLIIRLPPEKKE
ncbi:hypothetical protein RG963_05120 [Methanosarcina sp. Z-7115]|uniref:Uncharacterized protein n=1 Tax=Methanosarcina baikalica TaxID=3073890 RepID=A0ABU2CZM4_9EURY|nr:hypothetical protein [Methanosarcina sp. Z-7115]MDR7665174.1 hypothetical protein [Methanosarcina sp. Z-7115]